MRHATSARTAFAVAASLCALAMPVAAEPPMHADAKLIASAERAAPSSVSSKATIIAMDAQGAMRTLRGGSNGWTCMPDNPATPGPDSMCMDAAAFDWAKAWMGKGTPEAGRIGFMYMLEGGTDASNVDPYASAPSDDNAWIETGAHVMIVGADDAFYAMYPSDPDPDTSVPYVMWEGTPYQHLMIPVE